MNSVEMNLGGARAFVPLPYKGADVSTAHQRLTDGVEAVIDVVYFNVTNL